MNNLLRSLLKIQNKTRKKPNQSVSGFTMIELMVGAILAFLIITPLMGFVVSILEDDTREGLKAITDQEVNSAVDYMAEDLNQARYIYDREGLTAIADQLPAVDDGTPILVFWKRKLVKDAVPIRAKNVETPSQCDIDEVLDCNDTYLDALVAYYLVEPTSNDTEGVWCNPDSNSDKCPARIVRVEIQDGLKNSDGEYYEENELHEDRKSEQKKTQGFNALEGSPLEWTKADEDYEMRNLPQVLVNYIDRSQVDLPGDDNDEYCVNAFGGEVTSVADPNVTKEDDVLKIKTDTNSFVACVDSERNIAQILLRGNALRRKDANAEYNANKTSFFPTATVKVQGQSSAIKTGN
ncbi:hormogonium polysaccharide secretion pseudopilin HpsC [Capilliphycus salinus ALCB114379]|uniref:hormogonium polysaccharide secretion pseudopilin HpsC n=1 Tax=Capilliphycus salinus TaxID=2768948 RepID=UPI0039A68B67